MSRGFQNHHAFANRRSLSDGEINERNRLKMNKAWEIEVAAGSSVSDLITVNRKSQLDDESTTVAQTQQHIHKQNATALSRDVVAWGNILVMKQLVPLLLLLVGTKYQVKPDLLFTDNIVQLWCFVGAACIYWPTIEIMKKMTSHQDPDPDRKLIFNSIALACTVVSVFSLVSLLFPQHVPLSIFVASTSLTLNLGVILVLCVRFRIEILTSNFTNTLKEMFSNDTAEGNSSRV